MDAVKIFWKNKLVEKVIKNFNLCDTTGLFLYPLKVSENQMISDILGGTESKQLSSRLNSPWFTIKKASNF